MPEGTSDNSIPWWEQSQLQRDEKASPTTPYRRGVDNPFNTGITSAMSSFDRLALEGDATVTTHEWDLWNKSRGKVWFSEENEPSKTHQMTYTEIADKSAGWKLHLNFDANDPTKVQTIGEILTALKDNGGITDFKIGTGGGKSEGHPGKESTVYIGHRDKAQFVASLIEENLSEMLDLPEGNTLRDDIPFTTKIMGRFEVTKVDPQFHQYGAKGHSILNTDVMILRKKKRFLGESDAIQLVAEMQARADAILRQRYGVFYTGKNTTSAAAT